MQQSCSCNYRDCIRGEVTYIGANGMVGWYDCTVFAPAFYSALLRNRGTGVSPASQAPDAAQRASAAYVAITGRRCPYRSETLTPSRRAMKAFLR